MKKGAHPAGTARWLCLASSGSLSVVGMDKNAIMTRAGIHARDLRILDPQLSYPSIILGRERAIVLNLEYLKAIITAEEVFLRNPNNENVRRFAEELRRRILAPEAQLQQQQQQQHQEHQKHGQDQARRQSAGQSRAGTERAQPGGVPQADGILASSHPVTIFIVAPTGAQTLGSPLPVAPHNGSGAGVEPLGQDEVSRGLGGGTTFATSGHATAPQTNRGLLSTEITATGAAPVHIIPSLQVAVAGHESTGRHIGPGGGSHAGLRAAASAAAKASAEAPGVQAHATSDVRGHALNPEGDAAARLLVGAHSQAAEELHCGGAMQGEDGEYEREKLGQAGLGSGDGHGAGSHEDSASGRREFGAGAGLASAVNRAGAAGTAGRNVAGHGQGASGLWDPREGQPYGDGTGEGGTGAAAPPPFEFQALEVALESACKLLERQAGEFTEEAHEALDKLTSQVTSATLDGVRSMKNEMNQLISRVQKVREELELLLANDRDMAEMYLTDKLVLAAQQQQQQQQGPGVLATAGSMSVRGRRSTTPEAATDSLALDPSLSGNSSINGYGNCTANTTGNGYSSATARGATGTGGSSITGHTGLAADSFTAASSGAANGGLTGGLGSVGHKASPEGVHRALESVGEGDEGEEGAAWAFPSLLAAGKAPTEHQEPGGTQDSVLFGAPGADPQILELRQPSRSPSSSDSSGTSSSSSSSSSRSRGKKWDVEVLENLLEAYSSEMDKTLNELSSLREYVDDTEDYLNILLDEKQNSLLLMNILIQAATLSITTFLVVTAILAMNIPNAAHVAGTIYDGDIPRNHEYFKYMVGFGTAGTLVVFVAIIAYMWRRGLIDGSM